MAATGIWLVGTERVTYQVTHGVSMQPVYHQGDLIFITKAESYKVGQIAAYHGPVRGQVVLHRIINGDAAGFVFKGDNNPSEDALHPTARELIGRATLRVPHGGIWLAPVISPTGLSMLCFMAVSGLGSTVRNRRGIRRGRRKKRVRSVAGSGGSLSSALAVIKAIAALPVLLRVMAATIAVMGVFALGLGVVGFVKPSTVSRHATPATGQTMTFAYSATVAPSPAYDSTTVSSPDTVFRKLAHLGDS